MNRKELAQAITLIESTRGEDKDKAEVLLDSLQINKNSFRIGVSGVPGVGKSTFIDAFGSLLISLGHKVAVLAIDPSSPLTHGSILADKARMQRLSSSPNAFIRPTPSSGVLGGVAARTREVTLLCESAGYDIILIETVGIGQSETQVFDLTDAVLLLIPPSGGDELQGMKKGIIEIADILLVNKADGEFKPFCDQVFNIYSKALTLTPSRSTLWTPTLHKISSFENTGLKDVWEDLQHFRKTMEKIGQWALRRNHQDHLWLEEEICKEVWRTFKSLFQHKINQLEKKKSVSRYKATRLMVKDCFDALKK